MLTIHHLRLSQSERIVWLAEELGLDGAKAFLAAHLAGSGSDYFRNRRARGRRVNCGS